MTAFLLWVGPLLCYTAEDAVRLEKEAFAYRDHIQSGEVELHSVMSKAVRGEGNPRKLDRRKVWFFEGGRMRADEEEYYVPRPTQPGGDKYWVRLGLTDSAHLYCTEHKSRRAMPLGAAVRNPELVKGPEAEMGLTDFRWLGLAPRSSYNLRQVPVSPFLDRPDVEVTDVKDEVYEGAACVRAAFRRRDGLEGVIRIAPDRGPSVVAVSISGDGIDQEVRSRIEKHAASGIWFPTQCRYVRSKNGKVQTDETLTVKVLSLNQPLPPETFTFAGMGLPAGTEVSSIGLGEPTTLFWTGAELLPGYPVEPGGSSPWWLWLAGVSAVLIGLVLVVRSLARR
ncbi:MAG: hypothetical protein U0836_17710 [Pirellulales bacterium]